jgi:hypothetical protein
MNSDAQHFLEKVLMPISASSTQRKVVLLQAREAL